MKTKNKKTDSPSDEYTVVFRPFEEKLRNEKQEKEESTESAISDSEIKELLNCYREGIEFFGFDVIWPSIFEKHYHKKCGSINLQQIGDGFSILAPDGDEEVCSLVFCEKCQSYRLNCFHDQFMGDEDFTYEKELAPKEAEIAKEVILKCEKPDNKHCRCKYHEKMGDILYGGFLELLKQEMPKEGFKWSDKEKTWVEIDRE